MNKWIREQRRYIHNENKKFSTDVFVEIPREQWPANQTLLKRVFRSREFLVQVFSGPFERLSVNRTDLTEEGQWRDGITWDELQSCKNGCGYADHDAVEAFPKKSDVVNVANIRHLWIVPPDYAQFFWRTPKGSGTKSGLSAEEILSSKPVELPCQATKR